MEKVTYLAKKVREDMSEELKASEDLDKAVSLLEHFADMIKELRPSSFQTPQQWTQHLTDFFNGDSTWIEKLHVDHVLDVFGFPHDVSDRIKNMKHDENGEDLKQFSLRWVAKAFECFGLPGTTCDVVNLVCAMM